MGPAIEKNSSFWRKRWDNLELPVSVLLEDTLLFIVLLCALAVTFVGLRLVAAIGYEPEKVKILEEVHFWGYFSAVVVFILDLLGQLVVYAIGKRLVR